MITGQSPRYEWRPNVIASPRSLDEAIEIACANGVEIPVDVQFFVDEWGDLNDRTTARGPRIDKAANDVVWLEDLVHDRTGRIPFLVRPDILSSDEAIVAVLGHEMFELNCLRPFLLKGKLTMDQFIAETQPGNPGNFHDQAWDFADELVLKMRSRSHEH